jgi:hypothetical protein
MTLLREIRQYTLLFAMAGAVYSPQLLTLVQHQGITLLIQAIRP